VSESKRERETEKPRASPHREGGWGSETEAQHHVDQVEKNCTALPVSRERERVSERERERERERARDRERERGREKEGTSERERERE